MRCANPNCDEPVARDGLCLIDALRAARAAAAEPADDDVMEDETWTE